MSDPGKPPSRPAIHPLAAEGFGRSAEAYERGRPSYPHEAVAQLLRAVAAAPPGRVIDLAAGTGKLTRMLVGAGVAPERIVAVEPVAAMRDALASALPRLDVREGTAEAIPLGDGEAAAVLVAQAFHWFDGERAVAEIHRVLARSAGGGVLGIVFNARDESVGWVARLGALLDRHDRGAPRHRTGAWRIALDASPLFEPLVTTSFRHEQALDIDTLCDRVASISYIASLGDGARAALLDEVRALVATEGATRGRPTFVMPYRTDVHVTRRR